MLAPLPLLLLSLACAPATLEPDARLVGDPLLAALPADAALVGRAEVGSAVLEAGEAAGLVDLDAAPLRGRADRIAVACGAAGCLSLVEGELRPRAAPTDGPHLWHAAVGEGTLLWRRLAADKAVVGEAAAVRDLSAVRRAGGDGLDLAVLQGAVPAGQGWVVARDAELLADLSAARGLSLPPLPAASDRVETAALAWTLADARLDLTLRLVLVDEATARAAALRLRGARPAGWAGTLLDRGEVVVVGSVLEVQGAWLDLDELSNRQVDRRRGEPRSPSARRAVAVRGVGGTCRGAPHGDTCPAAGEVAP